MVCPSHGLTAITLMTDDGASTADLLPGGGVDLLVSYQTRIAVIAVTIDITPDFCGFSDDSINRSRVIAVMQRPNFTNHQRD